MNTKLTTLFGSKDVAVTFDDGRQDTLAVRQFKVKEYPALLPFVTDEITMCARACSKPRSLIESLCPASYQAVFDAMKEANADGFFSYAARQIEANLKNLPPEMLEKLVKGELNSSTRSATLPPPAA
jgi:hypothetical protein